MGNAVLNGINQAEATCKLKGGNRADVGVTVKIKFDTKEMLEEITIRT